MKRILILGLICLLVLVSAGCRVISTDFTLRTGETIPSDLTISGGHSTLEQGSRVKGSLHVSGGSVDALGEVDGDVLVTGGSINFGSSAVVHGVLSKTGGGVRIAPGAIVQSGSASAYSTTERVLGRVGSALLGIPLVLVIVFVLVMALRPRREGAPAVAAGQSPDAAAPAAGRLPASGREGRGIGAIVFGAIILVVGLLALLEQAFQVNVWGYGWALFLFLPGLFLLVVMLTGRGSGRLALPACILMVVGLVFLVQGVLDRYDTWAYAWALVFPTSIGIGHYIEGWWSNLPALRRRGQQETLIGLAVFIVLAAFFELVVNRDLLTADAAALLFPILLIVVGIGLIVSRLFNWPAATPGASSKS